MNRIFFLAAILLVLIIGGAMTAQFASDGAQTLPLAVEQVTDIEGSALAAAPWQAQQFMLLVGFLLVNLVGIALTIAGIMWFLNRQITRTRAESSANGSSEIEPAS